MINAIKPVAIACLFLAYPFLSAYLAKQGFASLELVVFAGITFWRGLKLEKILYRLATLALVVVLLVAAYFSNAYFIWLVPSFVYMGLTILFGHTLWSPPSLCERLVRLLYPDFIPGIAEYLRQVTWVWTVFFAVNVFICALLPLFAGPKAWAVYTGVLVYVLMSVLVIAEWLYRHKRFPDLEIPPMLETAKFFALNGHKLFKDKPS